jgi:RHH-type proline utilization regulon transcriptional repressor/proline dehydrogenase/delta 1-pyrroline-5-carboxylate dehydrogenase
VIQLLKEEKFDFAANIVFEASKPQKSALIEVEEAIDFALLYSRHISEILEPVCYQPHLVSEKNRLFCVPRGPTVAISAWNYPFSLLFEKIVSSYLAGCPVLVKPAEQTPLIGWRTVDLFLRAGIHPLAIALLTGGGAIGEELVKSKLIANICFTGSKKTGLWISKLAGQTTGKFGPKRVDLEMGGNNPMIVTRFADPNEALKGVIASKFGMAGQRCSALQRLYLVGKPDDSFWREWLNRLACTVSSLDWGHPADTKKRYQYNAVISESARDRLKEKISELRATKARVVLECVLDSLSGFFVGPAIFENVPHNHPVVSEEIFGPVLFVFFAACLEEAVRLANEYEHITCGLYSNLESEQEKFIQAMLTAGKSGNIYLNRPIVGSMVGRNPFGGRGLSGSGLKIGTPDRLKFFLDEVVVTKNLLSQGILLR